MPKPIASTAMSSIGAQQRAAVRYAFWACAVAVLVLSLLPGEGIPLPTTGWDKADHLLAYAALAALGCLGWAERGRVVLSLLPALLLFGIAIEGLQGLTGYRSADANDVWAEVLGMVAGVIVAWIAGGLLSRVGSKRSA